MAKSATPLSTIAGRYAGSLFELALADDALATVERDAARLEALIAASEDLRRLLRSPIFSAEEQDAAISAVMEKAGITGLVGNFTRVVARNRRLFALPEMLQALRRMIAHHRGEEAAEVTVAQKMTEKQEASLKSALRAVLGKDVTFHEKVDPAILGGLIVRIGSRQIDTSLRTRLSSLKQALKEVG